MDNNNHHSCEVQYSETIFQIVVTAQQEGPVLPAMSAQGGKVHLEFLVGVYRLVLQILTLFQTKKMSFSEPVFRPDLQNPYPFLDLAFRQKLCYNYFD